MTSLCHIARTVRAGAPAVVVLPMLIVPALARAAEEVVSVGTATAATSAHASTVALTDPASALLALAAALMLVGLTAAWRMRAVHENVPLATLAARMPPAPDPARMAAQHRDDAYFRRVRRGDLGSPERRRPEARPGTLGLASPTGVPARTRSDARPAPARATEVTFADAA